MNELKKDETLKKLSVELVNYCNSQHYQLILAVKTKNDEDGQIVNFTGDMANVIKNIVMFANCMEKEFEFPILKILRTACEGLIMTNDKTVKIIH